jgi:hypothetical protein
MAALAPNHSPQFAPSPALALRTGIEALVAAAAVWLAQEA